jgi:hypothetical protein
VRSHVSSSVFVVEQRTRSAHLHRPWRARSQGHAGVSRFAPGVAQPSCTSIRCSRHGQMEHGAEGPFCRGGCARFRSCSLARPGTSGSDFRDDRVQLQQAYQRYLCFIGSVFIEPYKQAVSRRRIDERRGKSIVHGVAHLEDMKLSYHSNPNSTPLSPPRSSSGCTHGYGAISCVSVSLTV